MKLAYLVLAHKNSAQIEMLINNLVDDYTHLYIHIDKKNEELYKHLSIKYKENSNVFIIKNRVSVNWSGFSQVQATLNLMKEAVNFGVKYDYVSLISGQCFPIKSNIYIREFLMKNQGKEFIQYRDITNDSKFLYRLKCYNFFRENQNIRKLYMRIIDNVLRRIQKPFVKRNNFKNMRLYHGSQWFTITFDCMKYVLNHIDKTPSIYNDFKFTMVPDEHFFQILILNSPFNKNVINNNLRYIDWENCKNSPKTLTKNDFDRLAYSSCLFARKFDIEEDSEIINYICELRNKQK